jgi:hypothetical protein
MADTTGNPWAAPPRPPIGDAEVNEIYRAVGEALSSWELVEEGVAQLFALFTSAASRYRNAEPAIRAYGSVVSFQARAEMVLAAGKCFFHGWTGDHACPFESQFDSLITECRGWSGRRNDVAHGRADQDLSGWFLFPGLYSTKKRPLGEPPGYGYTSDQITGFGTAFVDLYDRLSEYAGLVDRWLCTSLQNIIARHSPPDHQSPKNRQGNPCQPES